MQYSLSTELRTLNSHAIEFNLLPYPAFDLYSQLDFVCIATSRGCPLRCTYCASKILYNGFRRRNPDDVVEGDRILDDSLQSK